jgi:hypothetical protein
MQLFDISNSAVVTPQSQSKTAALPTKFFKIDISRKHFETTNSTRPNPPTPLPYEGRGISKPLSASLRGLERGLLSFSEMSNN